MTVKIEPEPSSDLLSGFWGAALSLVARIVWATIPYAAGRKIINLRVGAALTRPQKFSDVVKLDLSF